MVGLRARWRGFRASELGGLAGDSIYVYAWQAAMSIADLVQIALITHILGLHEYGRLALVLALVTVVGQLIDVRVGPVVTTFGVRRLAEADEGRAIGIFQFSYLIDAVTGLLGFLVIAAFAPLVADHVVGRDGTLLVLLYAVTLLVSTVDETSFSILRLLDRFRLLAGYTILLQVFRIVLVVGVLLLGYGLVGVLLVLVAYDVMAGATNLCFAARAVRQVTGRSLRRAALKDAAMDRRPMLRMVLHTNVASYARIAQVQLPTILLGVVGGAAQVGVYKVGAAAAAGIARLIDPAFVAILPRLSRLWSTGRREDVRRLLKRVTVIAGLAMATTYVVFIVLRHPILGLLGGSAAVESGTVVLALAGAAQLLNGVVFWNFPVLYAAGRAAVVAKISVASAVVQIVTLALLAPRFGASGAAGSLLASQVVTNVAATFLAKRALDSGTTSSSLYDSLNDEATMQPLVRISIPPGASSRH